MRFEICWVPFVSGRLLQLYDKVGEVDMIELQDLVGMCPIENWLIKTLVPVPSGTLPENSWEMEVLTYNQ